MRTEIEQIHEDQAFERLKTALLARKQKHGPRSFASKHETYGILHEEVHELVDALHRNDHQGFYDELLDIAVVCIFGMACMQQGAY